MSVRGGAAESASRFAEWMVIGSTFVVGATWILWQSSSDQVRAEHALGRRDYPRAAALAIEELRFASDSDRALVVAGSASSALNDPVAAKKYWGSVSDRDPSSAREAMRGLSKLGMVFGDPNAAERLLRACIDVDPNDTVARDQLIYLLTLQGRHWEIHPLIFDQLRRGVVTENYLLLLVGNHSSLEASVGFARSLLSATPNDPLPNLALALAAKRDNQLQNALDLVKKVVEKQPESVESLALYCQLLSEQGSLDETNLVFQSLPPTAEQHPLIWLARGILEERFNRYRSSARCYWESLRLDPNVVDANYRLSQVLVKLGDSENALVFATRSQKLTKLFWEAASLKGHLNVETVPSIARQLEELGRVWEAAAWCRVALQSTGGNAVWARSMERRLYGRLLKCPSYTEAAADPTRRIDLSHFEKPASLQPRERASPVQSGAAVEVTRAAKIRFVDDAKALGLDFVYANGESGGNTESMLEMNGGGVAVIDYDGDDWPDLFLTQGGVLPPGPFDPSQSDQLFRNCGDDGFESVDGRRFHRATEFAGLNDIGYGQGVTVGDFDSDGFPDLYVGNIGPNQLLKNNGDGTFSDVTAEAGVEAGGWTSSCAMADLNHDGLPDLYVVTYLAGEAPMRPCAKNINPRCSPLKFPAESDRVYLNLGDGRFREISNTRGLSAEDGRGLGLVISDLEGSGNLDIFVANDMTANFLFRNLSDSQHEVQFREEALLRGLAFDRDGQAKACMGVAAGDFNRDGRLDLFVTNFYRQSNDLYRQLDDGTFRDVSREARLYDPSFLQLGWGTQFLDADLDGHFDLIVTNGHVHEPIDPATPYQMRSQFFRNQGNGRFEELFSDVLGAFFDRKSLGRPLARLDWNRDGLDDACISYLNEPLALVSNRTESPGHYIALRLVGVKSSRDAIGARVTVISGAEKWFAQLTAGDGFQASNDRRLIIGLGEIQQIDALEIQWNSGVSQRIEGLAIDRGWVCIEGHAPIASSLRSEAND